MKVGMSRYNMQSGCTWKDMYFQEVGLFYLTPLALRNFIFLQTQLEAYKQLKGHQGQVYLRNSNSKCLKSFLDKKQKTKRMNIKLQNYHDARRCNNYIKMH